jgi:hypothetical protein
MKSEGKTRIKAVKTKFMQQMVKFTWMDCKRNEDIFKN